MIASRPILFLFVLVSGLAMAQDPIFPDRPGGTLSPFTLGPRNIQFETGTIYMGARPSDSTFHTILLQDISYRIGLSKRIETNGQVRFGGHFLTTNGVNDYHDFGFYDWRAGFRFKILQGKGFKPTLSLQAGALGNFPPAISIQPELRLLTCNSWNKFFVAANLGVVWFVKVPDFYFPFALKFGTGLDRNCGIMVDIAGTFFELERVRYGVGIWSQPLPGLRIDLFGSLLPMRPIGWTIQMGLAWRLDWTKKT